jgi:hypothetical protein
VTFNSTWTKPALPLSHRTRGQTPGSPGPGRYRLVYLVVCNESGTSVDNCVKAGIYCELLWDFFFFTDEGPRSRRYGRTAALRLLVQP